MAEQIAFMRQWRWAQLGLGVALLAGASPVAAGGAGLNVSLSVPVLCSVQALTELVVSNGRQASGSVVEACNVPGGYTVTANYRPLAADEAALLQYNGQSVSLPASGTVVVHASTLATIKQVAYELTSQHLNSPLAVSLSIQPAA